MKGSSRSAIRGPPAREYSFCKNQIDRARDFESLFVPRDHQDLDAQTLDKTGIVSVRWVIGIDHRVRIPQRLSAKTLWCLDRSQCRSIGCPRHARWTCHRVINCFDCVGQWETRNNRSRAIAHRGDYSINKFDWHQGPGRVVHQNHIDLGTKPDERPGHRLLACFATGHDGELNAL
jgi:hypothetical protein